MTIAGIGKVISISSKDSGLFRVVTRVHEHGTRWTTLKHYERTKK